MQPSAYRDYIVNPKSWGGYIELVCAAELHFQAEIVTFDVGQACEHVFNAVAGQKQQEEDEEGDEVEEKVPTRQKARQQKEHEHEHEPQQGEGAAGGRADAMDTGGEAVADSAVGERVGESAGSRVFLVYTGAHYDCLALAPTAGTRSGGGNRSRASDQTVFAADDAHALAAARELCAELHVGASEDAGVPSKCWGDWRRASELPPPAPLAGSRASSPMTMIDVGARGAGAARREDE